MSLFGSFAKDKHFSELAQPLDENGDTVTSAERRNRANQNIVGSAAAVRADYGLRRAVVAVTNTELEALAATPKIMIAAPGAGKQILLYWYRIYVHFNGDAQDDAAADGNLRLRSTGTSVAIAASAEADGLVDATADTMLTATEGWHGVNAPANFDNRSIELYNDGAEFTGGDSTLTVELFYRIIDTIPG